MYLEPIFGRGALPREQGRFQRVNDDFRYVNNELSKEHRLYYIQYLNVFFLHVFLIDSMFFIGQL